MYSAIKRHARMLCLIILATNVIHVRNVYAFDMYIQTGFVNTPDFSTYGFKCSEIIYEQQIFDPKADRSLDVDDKVLTRLANKFKTKPECPVVLDIEYWMDHINRGHHKDYVKTLHRYADHLSKFHALLPDHKIGYYGIVPAWAHWDIMTSRSRYETWLYENEAADVVANSADVLYPSLYTYHAEFDEWKMWAKEIIIKARAMSNGKKIIPYIWPKYHQSSMPYRKGARDLPDAFWRSQLEFLRDNADGFVIWDGALGSEGQWKNDASWWKVTTEYITKNNLNIK